MRLFIFFALSLFLVSCGKEGINPLYTADPIKIKAPVIRITSEIGLTNIPENAVSGFFDKFFGWIPGVGHLYEVPIDMLRVVLPTLSSKQVPHLPDGADWRDPRLLKTFSSIKLTSGYLRAPGQEELKARLAAEGKEYKGEKCGFLIFFCSQPGVEFLREMRLYIVFGKDLSCMDPGGKCPEKMEAEDVLLAHATFNKPEFYHRDSDGTEWVTFGFENTDIRPYFEKYRDFRVKVIAEGKPPTREAYIEGAFTVQLVLAR